GGTSDPSFSPDAGAALPGGAALLGSAAPAGYVASEVFISRGCISAPQPTTQTRAAGRTTARNDRRATRRRGPRTASARMRHLPEGFRGHDSIIEAEPRPDQEIGDRVRAAHTGRRATAPSVT